MFFGNIRKNKIDIDIARLPFESVERAVTVQAVTLTDEPECQQAVKQASHQAHGGEHRRRCSSSLHQ